MGVEKHKKPVLDPIRKTRRLMETIERLIIYFRRKESERACTRMCGGAEGQGENLKQLPAEHRVPGGAPPQTLRP